MAQSLWHQCLDKLEDELSSQQFNTWIRPLQAEEVDGTLRLLSPNRFVQDWVTERFRERIDQLVSQFSNGQVVPVEYVVGSRKQQAPLSAAHAATSIPAAANDMSPGRQAPSLVTDQRGGFRSHLNPNFTYDTFVAGKTYQLAVAASEKVAESPGDAYNPLFIYGGVGLGKTHLMHAIGNRILQNSPGARVLYLHSERFVADMVKALQQNAINDFKRFYRGLDALLIDDIQFFAGKERSQEEFFHTFNALLEGQKQVILTCDRYPKELQNVEERLKSRFGWGLTVVVEPPEFETRAAILHSKAKQANVDLPEDVAYLIAKNIRSNVRELEGALRRVIANAHFTGQAITVDFARQALSDLLAVQAKMITIENIQKTVAEYYKIRVSDLHSKRRNRSIARPRQMAMALAKELTEHSLPEIGDAFGGRDHTTVIHGCKKIAELRDSDQRIAEDYDNLLRTLST